MPKAMELAHNNASQSNTLPNDQLFLEKIVLRVNVYKHIRAWEERESHHAVLMMHESLYGYLITYPIDISSVCMSKATIENGAPCEQHRLYCQQIMAAGWLFRPLIRRLWHIRWRSTHLALMPSVWYWIAANCGFSVAHLISKCKK